MRTFQLLTTFVIPPKSKRYKNCSKFAVKYMIRSSAECHYRMKWYIWYAMYEQYNIIKSILQWFYMNKQSIYGFNSKKEKYASHLHHQGGTYVKAFSPHVILHTHTIHTVFEYFTQIFWWMFLLLHHLLFINILIVFWF